MVMTLAFRPDDPGSFPGLGYIFFIISNRDKKVKVPEMAGMQHLNLLQIQENGISELNFDAAQWGHIAVTSEYGNEKIVM